MSKWSEIRIDHFDDIEGVWLVDAWKTDDDNESGVVIAEIHAYSEEINYIDPDAKTDEDAQEVIKEFLENGYVLTE